MRKNRSNSVFLSRVDELLVLVPVEPNPQFAQEAWYGAVPCGWWVPTWVAWTSNGWRMPVIKRGNGHPSCIDDLRHKRPFRWLNDSQDWLKRLLNNGYMWIFHDSISHFLCIVPWFEDNLHSEQWHFRHINLFNGQISRGATATARVPALCRRPWSLGFPTEWCPECLGCCLAGKLHRNP